MSKLLVKIDYKVASTIIKGLRGWLDKLSDMLDNAARKKIDIPCRRYNGPDRREKLG